MRKINTQTTIELSLGSALSVAAAFGAALLGLNWLMIDGLRSDLSDARASIENVVKESSATASKVQVLDGGLNNDVKSIADQYELLSTKLTENGMTLVALTSRVETSIKRQQQFEAYVISRISTEGASDIKPPLAG